MASEKRPAGEPYPLAERLKNIREARLRIEAVREWASRCAADDAGQTIADLIDAAGGRSPDAQIALHSLAEALQGNHLSYDFQRDLYEWAKEADRDDVGWLFLDVFGTQTDEEELDEERPLTPTSKPLSLGERKALARGHKRDVLELLLRDPHPMVVEHLLGNPRVTESDILVVATRRPQRRDNLLAICRSSKWIARRAVKRAVVLNPFTPPLASVRLLTTLPLPDIKEVRQTRTLHDMVRTYATLLHRRWTTRRGA